MKTSRLFVVLAASLSVVAGVRAAEVETGDSLAEVHATLGAPRGQVVIEGRRVLYYDRGEVELANDGVIRVALRTPEEQAELEARAERQRAERAVRRNQLVAEGTALRDQKLADEDFRSAPLAYQVAFWETFARSYPEVSVREPLTIARMKLGDQLAEKRRKEDEAARLAEIEQCLEEARNPASSNFYPLYTTSPYDYSYRRHPYYPPSLGPIRYDFWNTSAAPYETPHGSPYETPHGSPYETPRGAPYQTPRVAPYQTPRVAPFLPPASNPAGDFRGGDTSRDRDGIGRY